MFSTNISRIQNHFKTILRLKVNHNILFSVPGFPSPFGMGYLVNPYAAYAQQQAQLVSNKQQATKVTNLKQIRSDKKPPPPER